MSDKPILAGDVGGTKTSLGLFKGTPEAPEPLIEKTYLNREFPGLTEIASQFLSSSGLPLTSACFGVAGAVIADEAALPNLGWHIAGQELARKLGIKQARLINDLEANAYGIATLRSDQFQILNAGHVQPGGNTALISAGTGLGMAILLRDGEDYRVMASEGGHMDFAPRNEEEVSLWRHLAARHGHVSVERVVSGQGLTSIYDFLLTGDWDEPDWLAQRFRGSLDRTAVIAQAGLHREAAICIKTLNLFLSAYGAVAGNLALMAKATGGIYLGGGIAPKLAAAFHRSGFMTAFTDKGRFGKLLASVPVTIILEPKTALYGAARLALGQIQE